MKLDSALKLLFLLPSGLFFCSAHASEWELNLNAGLMQQPASQYYHYVYGIGSEVGFFEKNLLVRYTYVERPRFESAGFIEKEYGNFLLIGTQVNQSKKPYSLNAYLGTGRMQGYIAANSEYHELNLPMRKYQINGICLLMEARYQLGKFIVAISHQNFSGIVNRDDMDSYVIWPFHFYFLNLGWRI